MRPSWKLVRAISMAVTMVMATAGPPARAEVVVESDVTSEVVADLGRKLYVERCASCHGSDARGGGPVAPTLASAPSDLTRIGARNDGRFDVTAVAARIDGREMPAVHGSNPMPVWGRRFSDALGGGEVGEEAVRGNLLVLVEYLRTLQR